MSDNRSVRESMQVAVSASQFIQLMAPFESSYWNMDTKLLWFEEEIRQGKEETALRAVKWACYKKSYIFRRCHNEEQAGFKSKVDEAMTQVESELSAVKSSPSSIQSIAVQQAKQAIQKGQSLLKENQKLIWLADCSEHAWG